MVQSKMGRVDLEQFGKGDESIDWQLHWNIWEAYFDVLQTEKEDFIDGLDENTFNDWINGHEVPIVINHFDKLEEMADDKFWKDPKRDTIYFPRFVKRNIRNMMEEKAKQEAKYRRDLEEEDMHTSTDSQTYPKVPEKPVKKSRKKSKSQRRSAKKARLARENAKQTETDKAVNSAKEETNEEKEMKKFNEDEAEKPNEEEEMKKLNEDEKSHLSKSHRLQEVEEGNEPRVEALTQELFSLRKEITLLDEERVKLKEEVKEGKARNVSLVQQLQEAQRGYERHIKEIETEYSTDIARLQDQLSTLEAEMANATALNNDLLSRVKTLETANEELREKLNANKRQEKVNFVVKTKRKEKKMYQEFSTVLPGTGVAPNETYHQRVNNFVQDHIPSTVKAFYRIKVTSGPKTYTILKLGDLRRLISKPRLPDGAMITLTAKEDYRKTQRGIKLAKGTEEIFLEGLERWMTFKDLRERKFGVQKQEPKREETSWKEEKKIREGVPTIKHWGQCFSEMGVNCEAGKWNKNVKESIGIKASGEKKRRRDEKVKMCRNERMEPERIFHWNLAPQSHGLKIEKNEISNLWNNNHTKSEINLERLKFNLGRKTGIFNSASYYINELEPQKREEEERN